MRQRRLGASLVGTTLLALASVLLCARAPLTDAGVRRLSRQPVLVARARYIMGAPLEVRAYATANGREDAMRALDAALDEVERLDAVMSSWKQDSELSMVNRAAATEPVACSTDLFRVLEASLAASDATGGAFDPGLEAPMRALGLLGAGAGEEARREAATDPGEAGASRSGPGKAIVLDRRRRTVRFTNPGAGLDLGGIGKGYALDAAAQVLRARGVEAALLNFGGQVLAAGAPPGEK